MSKPTVSIEVFQQDWIPGFAAFADDGSVQEGQRGHVVLNLGSLLGAVEVGDLNKSDLPYMVAESLMHEAIHALEAWANVEFNEEKVETLLERYRKQSGQNTVWQADCLEENPPVRHLNDYQERAAETAIYPWKGEIGGLTYTALKLAGEAGEVAEKLGKIYRDDKCVVSEAKRQEMKKEVGDVLWYVAAIAGELGFTLEEIADANLAKLASRKERGVLGGSGDNR